MAGVAFMLLPGTLLGAWSLIMISDHRSLGALSPAWIQAHGHAQVFGWIGSFILGIGFYSLPGLRTRNLPAAWSSLAMWSSGVALRWFAGAYAWHWRALLPASALLELAGFLLFLFAARTHRPEAKGAVQPWLFAAGAGTLGFLLALIVNFAGCVRQALNGAD